MALKSQINLTPASVLIDEVWGKKGTPRRDRMEQQLQQEIHAQHIGEAIRHARKEKNMTQEQLGALMGVRRAQISKIESGKSLNFATIARAFKAIDVPGTLVVGNITVPLW